MQEKVKPFYSFKYDIVFKTIFGDENNFSYLEELLKECLSKKIKIIRLIPTEVKVSNVLERKKRLDLLVEAEGQKINVEIDTAHDMLTRIRNLNFFYAFCSAHTTVGNKYDLDTEFIHISLNYDMGKKDHYICEYQWYDKKHRQVLPVKHRYIEVNVEKYGRLWYDKNIEAIGNKKFLTLIGIKEVQELRKYAENIKSKEISKVVEKVQRLNESDAFIYHITPEEDEELTKNTYIYYAELEGKREGILEGKKEGFLEAKINIAKNLLQKNYDISTITEITGLKRKEIENLVK